MDWRAVATAAVAAGTGLLFWELSATREGLADPEVRELRAALERIRKRLSSLIPGKGGATRAGPRRSAPKRAAPRRGGPRAPPERSARGGASDESGPAKDAGKGSPGGPWRTGKMTYYWASEPDIGHGTGAIGAGGKRLVAKRSVAVKKALWSEYEGAQVEIQGMGVFSVDDYCVGGGCKDIDMYVGKTQGGHDGIKSIRYRFLPRK